MKHGVVAALAVAFCVTLAAPAMAQEPPPHAAYPDGVPPNAPHYVQSAEVPGLNLRFLDFKWDPEAFATLEKGGEHPVGRRSWVLARLLTRLAPFRCEGKIVPVGPSLLILNPARGSAGPTLELRYIDMREVFVDMNVIAEPPPGETYCKIPAAFRKVDTSVPRLKVTMTEGKGTIDVISHYGDRETRVTLVR